MSQKTKAQIQAESNSTYVDNTVGSITPANVRTLNTDWIDSIVFLDMTGSFIPTNAVSASNAATASFLLGSIASASFANTSATASLAITASFAISASRAITADSATSATTAISASYSVTSSLATQNLTTASAVANILTFTKGDGTTFNVTIAQSGSVASASYADVANFANSANSASYAFTASSATNAANSISASYAFTASSAERSTTASFAISASRAISAATAVSATTATSALTAISASQATNANNALTASFVAGYATLVGNNTLSGNNTFTGTTTFNNAVTMSNVQVNGTASIQYLNVVFQSSSIIYSSGSNQLGDAANDTQTLWGTVNVISGPLVVTGSSNFKSAFTASGLNYPTADSGEFSFIQTDGNGNLSLQYVNTLSETVYNGDSVTLVKGTPVYVSGSQGANSKVFAADAANANKMPVIFILADTITAGSTGRGITLGDIDGVDTTGYPAGTTIYVAEGGGWTSTRPVGANSIIQTLGIVTKEGAGGQGLVLNPGPATLPNISQGNLWVGNSSNQPALVTTSSLVVTNAISASFVVSASFANSANTASFTPNAFVSASNYLTNDTIVLYKEGIGSNNVTINNVQSASYADNANTANSATTATNATSASLAQLALTASYFDGLVASASYAILAETANTALTANTANSALTAINADTASFVSGNVASASYAATASGVQGINASLVNSTYYLGFVPNADVNAISIDTDLRYNPSTGVLTSNQFTGALNGNASTATTATSATSASFAVSSSRAISAESVTSASFAQTSITASFATNFTNSGSYVITGSHRGNVVSQSIASSTASFDFSTGNFFTLNLTGSTLTHISASNIQAGQTVNVRITQGATTGSVSFSPAFDQVSGSAYVPTQVANAVDILTFITFDNSLIYVSNIKNLV